MGRASGLPSCYVVPRLDNPISLSFGVGPTTLGGVSVSVGGTAAYVDYVSPGQVNALVSSNAPFTGPAGITVSNGNGTSDPYPIYINQLQPGFLAPGSFVVGGKQYVAALLSDSVTFAIPQNAIQGVPSRAALIGEAVTIYGIGFGPGTPAFTAGTSVTDLNTVTNPLQISFGTTQAATTYQGLAPGFCGAVSVQRRGA
jgi:uncharacterized protein (TIGR03437 family)